MSYKLYETKYETYYFLVRFVLPILKTIPDFISAYGKNIHRLDEVTQMLRDIESLNKYLFRDEMLKPNHTYKSVVINRSPWSR